MKNRFTKALVLSGALLLSAHASAAYVSLDDVATWGINSSGGGTTSGVIIATDYINFDGYSYTDSSDDLSSFTDYGYLAVDSYHYDGSTVDIYDTYGIAGVIQESTYSITAEFTDWSGTYTSYDAGEDEVNFEFNSGGTINWYSEEDLILVATIVNGTGDLNLSGDENGQINIQFVITSVEAGYFFIDINGDGIFTDDEDLATLLANSDEPYYFGYSTSNNQIEDSANDTLTALLDEQGYDPEDIATSPYDFVTHNVGSYSMATIPEPGMLSLMGLAFLGLAGFQRRRKNN